MEKFKQVLEVALAGAKLIGVIALIIVSAGLLYRFLGGRQQIELLLEQLTWKRAATDTNTVPIKKPLTGAEIDGELKKLRGGKK